MDGSFVFSFRTSLGAGALRHCDETSFVPKRHKAKASRPVYEKDLPVWIRNGAAEVKA